MKTKVDGGGQRFNEGKTAWHLLPMGAVEGAVKVMMLGAKKYSKNNWKRGFTYSSILDCAIRHLMAVRNGEWLDKESGLPHVCHVICNMVFLFFFHDNPDKYKKFDDREMWGDDA